MNSESRIYFLACFVNIFTFDVKEVLFVTITDSPK